MSAVEAASILDVMANPHPTMWGEACAAYRAATSASASTRERWRWFGFWDAMRAATGYAPEVLWDTLQSKLGVDRVESRELAVYLAGPINGTTDAEASGWRNEVAGLLRDNGLSVKDPMILDYRGAEDNSATEIVEGDKDDIASSDAVLAYCPKPSVGTSMEVIWAAERGIFVVVVVPPGAPVSPWLRYHANLVLDDLSTAVRVISTRLASLR